MISFPSFRFSLFLGFLAFVLPNSTVASGACLDRKDVLFILDESGSVGSDNYQIMENWVRNYIGTIPESVDVEIGVISFNRVVEEIIDFTSDRSAIYGALDQADFQAGSTNTRLALERALSMIQTQQQTEQTDPTIILITDGSPVPYRTATPCNTGNTAVMIPSLNATFQGTGTNILTIAIGNFNLAATNCLWNSQTGDSSWNTDDYLLAATFGNLADDTFNGASTDVASTFLDSNIAYICPTNSPTGSPTASPSIAPTVAPTGSPTIDPTASPTAAPTLSPTASPTANPTSSPTASPSASPTASPTACEPILTCPEDITIPATADCKAANEQYPSYSLDQQQCAQTPTVTQTAGPLPGTPLGIGSYTIEYTAEEVLSGEKVTCDFVVTVEDQEDLVVDNFDCGNSEGVIKPCQVPLFYTATYAKTNGCPSSVAIDSYQCQFCNGADKTVDKLAGGSCVVSSNGPVFRIDESGGTGDIITYGAQVTDEAGRDTTFSCSICVNSGAGGCGRNLRHLQGKSNNAKNNNNNGGGNDNGNGSFTCPADWDIKTSSYSCPLV